MRPIAGIVVTVLAMISLAAADAAAKHLTLTFAIAQILWVRYLIYFFYGCVAATRDGGSAGFTRAGLGPQLLRGVTLVVANLVVVYSFSRLPLADVHAVIAVAPLLVMAASVFLLGERVVVGQWFAVAVGFVGILVILRPGAGVLNWVSLSPLLGAMLHAAYQVMTKWVSRFDRQGATQFYTGASGLLGFSALLAFVPWQTPDAGQWLGLVGAGVLGTLAHMLIIKGLHLAPASTVQPYTYSMLVAATIFGYLFFDDIPDVPTIGGAVIVVSGGLYALACEKQRRQRVE
ncbi:MAG: DMT family transporter [Pseudomonadota bacterium]